jgi:hypothetical protein
VWLHKKIAMWWDCRYADNFAELVRGFYEYPPKPQPTHETSITTPTLCIYCYHNTFLVRSNKIPSTNNAEGCEYLLWCFFLLCKTTTAHHAKVHNPNQPKMMWQTNDHALCREIPMRPNLKCSYLRVFLSFSHHFEFMWSLVPDLSHRAKELAFLTWWILLYKCC